MPVEQKPLKILVVDDSLSTRMLLRALLMQSRHRVVEAADGQAAITVFAEELPDMVIMDVNMPVMDGYEASMEIKRRWPDRFIPIVFLTAESEEDSLVQCLDSGGDDILTKPFSATLLQAKIRAMRRILELSRSLEEYREGTEAELQLARHVFSTITQRMKEFIPGLGHWTQSAGHLPGDLILYDTAPSGQVYAMIADFTGHGLAAAVGAIPVADIFFALTKKDFALADIVVEINRKLRIIFPVGHFCAAAFVSSDPATGHLSVWNAGLPEILLVNNEREVTRRFPSRALALAIIDINAADVVMETVETAFGHKLVAVTDGLTEVMNEQGESLGEEGLIESIRETDGKPLFEALQQSVITFSQGTKPHDDISLLVLPINYSNEMDLWE